VPALLRDYLENIRLFSRNARLFLGAAFCFGFGFGTFWVLENLYLREFGLEEGAIGRVLACQSVGTMLVALPASVIASRVRLKGLLIASALLAALGFACLVTLPALPLLYLSSAVAGAGFIVHHVVSAPFFMRNSSPRERLHLFGVKWALEILASVVGVMGGGWLARHLGETLGSPLLGLRITLLLAAASILLSLLPYALIHSPRPAPEDALDPRLWRHRRPRRILRLAFPSFLIGLGAGLIIPFLNLYFRDRFHADADRIGLIFGASQALTALGFVAGPVLARRFGMIQTVVGAQLASIPFFLALALTGRMEVAILAFWMRAALMNMNTPILSNFAMEVVDARDQTLTNAFLELSWSVSWMVSAQVGGILIQNHGFTPPFLITITLYGVAAVLLLLFFRGYESRVLVPRRQLELRNPLPEGPA
jgi:predicted MFS family arabinose efflux permease